MSVLQIDRVSKRFGPVLVIDAVSLVVGEGEFVCIVGHSGCGKSTLMAMVAGLLAPSAGTIRGQGRRGLVFQSPSLLPWLSARGNVQLAVDTAFPRLPRAERRARAEHQLARVGLADVMGCRPGQLSAGMRQRVGLARALALEPGLLLLDEPFGMLDSVTRAELHDLLGRLGRKTTLMITHDLDEALHLGDRIVVMTDGPAARIADVVTVTPRTSRAELEALLEGAPPALSMTA